MADETLIVRVIGVASDIAINKAIDKAGSQARNIQLGRTKLQDRRRIMEVRCHSGVCFGFVESSTMRE